MTRWLVVLRLLTWTRCYFCLCHLSLSPNCLSCLLVGFYRTVYLTARFETKSFLSTEASLPRKNTPTSPTDVDLRNNCNRNGKSKKRERQTENKCYPFGYTVMARRSFLRYALQLQLVFLRIRFSFEHIHKDPHSHLYFLTLLSVAVLYQ